MSKQTSNRQTTLNSRFSSLSKLLILFFCLPFLLQGCGDQVDKKTLVWSPNGENAIFKASDGIRFTDKNGNLTAVLLSTEKPIVWTPDSKGVIAVCREEIQSWEQLRRLLSEQSQKDIAYTSTVFAGLAVKYSSPVEHEKLNKTDQQRVDQLLTKVRLQDVMTYLYFNDRESYDLLFKKNEKDKEIRMASLNSVKSFNFIDNKLILNAMHYTTNNDIVDLSASPNNKAIAIVESNIYENHGKSKLKIINRKNNRVVEVSNKVKQNIKWFKSNNRIVYFQESGDDKNNYGYLNWAQVFDKNEKMINEPSVEQLATIGLDDNDNNLICTNNGQIFFTSTTRNLPSANNDKSSKQSLFMMEPIQLIAVTKVLTRDINNVGCKYIDVSQNGKRVCLLDEDGTVRLVELKSANCKNIQTCKMGKNEFETACIFPQFRTNDELCFSVPQKRETKADRIAELTLLNLNNNKSKSISKNWPKESVEFLYEKESKQKVKNKNEK